MLHLILDFTFDVQALYFTFQYYFQIYFLELKLKVLSENKESTKPIGKDPIFEMFTSNPNNFVDRLNQQSPTPNAWWMVWTENTFPLPSCQVANNGGYLSTNPPDAST